MFTIRNTAWGYALLAWCYRWPFRDLLGPTPFPVWGGMRVEQYGLMCPLADRVLRVRGNLDQHPRAREGKWGGFFCGLCLCLCVGSCVLSGLGSFPNNYLHKRMLLLTTFLLVELSSWLSKRSWNTGCYILTSGPVKLSKILLRDVADCTKTCTKEQLTELQLETSQRAAVY